MFHNHIQLFKIPDDLFTTPQGDPLTYSLSHASCSKNYSLEASIEHRNITEERYLMLKGSQAQTCVLPIVATTSYGVSAECKVRIEVIR